MEEQANPGGTRRRTLKAVKPYGRWTVKCLPGGAGAAAREGEKEGEGKPGVPSRGAALGGRVLTRRRK